MKTKIIRILIIGFGNIGGGVAEVISRKKENIAKKQGLVLKIVGIADLKGVIINKNGLSEEDIRKFKTGEKIEKTRDLNIIKEIEHEVMVEATPTNIENGEPGLTHIIAALESNRHVVTSNKGPLALEYKRLMDLAAERGKEIRFGATVGGSLPIISLVKDNLASNGIISIKGILNGTCNYILTRMAEQGLPYEHVLKEAQELGIAESDPSKDVEGIDTAVKLVILANSVFDRDVSYKDVQITGIKDITSEALEMADEAGYAIKLLGEVNKGGCLKVAPRLVPKDNPLNVRGTLNVVTIKTDLAGNITILGKGAGPIETASAILSDILGIYKHNNENDFII
ncbi:homoserine dehydrogenase [Patescibacteria group bacterium]|nr:homoserine dehydrogenase [Patescibacteria group bacterium]MBU4481107.1 homoserine dehydrogenase [Patescibacteria group bacterium]